MGAVNNYQPMSLNDIHYDETANAIVAVGGMADNTGLTTSVGMVIEAINENTFTVLNQFAAAFLCTTSGTPNPSLFFPPMHRDKQRTFSTCFHAWRDYF